LSSVEIAARSGIRISHPGFPDACTSQLSAF
jgi:hypothetical protein